MINLFFSTENIQNINATPVNNDRFSLEFRYNGRGFPGILRYPIAINQDNQPSNRIKIVIQVRASIIEIITIYPV